MANNIYKKKDIKLDTFEDLNCKGVIASFSQGDRVSDKLLLRLTNDGVPLDLTDATQVRIDFRKPDGKLVFQYCIMEDKPNGLISAVLTTQTLAAPGKVYSEVTVKYPEGKDVVTRQFNFHVEEAIASDKSIESQNEWPMLERAIVAGDMLAGVDLVAIIQAGELAKGALPKTGGTMTGNIVKDRKLTTNSIYDQFVTGSTSNYFVGVSAAGKYHLYDDIAKITPFEYDPVAKSFNVLSATNVVKKAEAFTDYWTATGRTKGITSGTDLNTVQTSGAYSGSGLVNTPEGKTTFFYVEVIQHNDARYCKQIATDLATGSPRTYVRNMNNNVWGAWQEIISTLGGTLSGPINLNGTGAATKKLAFLKDGTEVFNLYAFSDTHFGIRDVIGGKNIWEYNVATSSFDILQNTNVLKKAGDTMVGVLNARSSIKFDGPGGGQVEWTQDPTQSSARGAMYYNSDAPTTIVSGMGRYKTPSADVMFMGWGSSPWSQNNSLTVSANQITYKNFAVATAEKDGTTTLSPSAEATFPDSNYQLQAVRRNNTVTLKGAVTLNANATGVIVATLSADLRPAGGNLSIYTPTADGTAMVQVFVNGSTGAIAISPNGKGKRVDFVLTYAI